MKFLRRVNLEDYYEAVWVTSTSYSVGDKVSNGSFNYECISAHTSGASTKPGEGASWDGKWKQITEALEVEIEGVRYVLVAHQSAN